MNSRLGVAETPEPRAYYSLQGIKNRQSRLSTRLAQRLTAGLCGLLLGYSGLAHAEERPGRWQLPLPPEPTPGPQQDGPRRSDSGQPLPFQSQFELSIFMSSSPVCRSDLTGARVRLTGEAPLQADPLRLDGQHQVTIELNGRTERTFSVRRSGGMARIDEVVEVPGAGGDHQVVFVLNGVIRSPVYRFSHSCLEASTSRAAAPGVVQQDTEFVFLAQVGDGLRSGPNAASETPSGGPAGSSLKLVLQTTDGQWFEFKHWGGIPDNSILRMQGRVPMQLNSTTLHRVMLYIDDAPLAGFGRIADAGDSASFGWMLIELGHGEGPRARIWQTGQINLVLRPKRWWQSPMLSMRQLRADTPVRRLSVSLSTGADDLRVGPLRPIYHSIAEVFMPVRVDLGSGLTGSGREYFGAYSDEQARRLLGWLGPTSAHPMPEALTAAEERQLLQSYGDAETLRQLRIKRMRRAFLFDSSGLMPIDDARRIRPFGAHSVAMTRLSVPPGTTLRDVATVFTHIDLGSGGSIFDPAGRAEASIQADQWDFAGVALAFEDHEGRWRTLYSDMLNLRLTSSRTFAIQVPDQTLLR